MPRIFHGGKTEKPKIEAECRERSGVLGEWATSPTLHQLGGLGSTVSSRSVVRGGVPTTQRFSSIFSTQHGLYWHYNIVNNVNYPVAIWAKTPVPPPCTPPPCVRPCNETKRNCELLLNLVDDLFRAHWRIVGFSDLESALCRIMVRIEVIVNSQG